MNQENTKEMLKTIENVRENLQNQMQIFLDSYTEMMSKLDFLTHTIIKENK